MNASRPPTASLAQRVREAAVNAGIPRVQATVALLEAAWALALGETTAKSGSPER